MVAILPFLIVIASRAGRDWFPAQDLAVIDLRSRDLFSASIPLTGAWSRLGFAHPGPLHYWFLGVSSALTNHAPWSLIVGHALLQIIAVAATARLAWRRGGLALTLLMLTVMSLAYVAIEQWGLVAPWNPYAAYPFLVVLVLLAWSIGDGDVQLLPWYVLVGTFLVQTHMGYAVLVSAVSAWVVMAVVRNHRAELGTVGALRRPLVIALGLGFLLWLPPLLDQLFATGNLGALAEFTFRSTDPRSGLRAGAGWYAAAFRFPPASFGGHSDLAPISSTAIEAPLIWLVVPAALLIALWRGARINGDRSGRTLSELVAVLTVATVVSLAAISGDSFGYLMVWRYPAALVLVASAVWVWSDRRQRPRSRRIGGAVLVATLLVATSVLSYRVVDYPRLVEPGEALAPLVRGLVTRAPRRPFLVRPIGSEELGLAETVVDHLDRRGRPVRVDDGQGFRFGPRRTESVRKVTALWIVAESGWVAAEVDQLPDAHVVAKISALPQRDETELRQLERRALRRLGRSRNTEAVSAIETDLFGFVVTPEDHIDQPTVDRIATLSQRARQAVCRCSIIAVPITDPSLRRLRALERRVRYLRKDERAAPTT